MEDFQEKKRSKSGQRRKKPDVSLLKFLSPRRKPLEKKVIGKQRKISSFFVRERPLQLALSSSQANDGNNAVNETADTSSSGVVHVSSHPSLANQASNSAAGIVSESLEDVASNIDQADLGESQVANTGNKRPTAMVEDYTLPEMSVVDAATISSAGNGSKPSVGVVGSPTGAIKDAIVSAPEEDEHIDLLDFGPIPIEFNFDGQIFELVTDELEQSKSPAPSETEIDPPPGEFEIEQPVDLPESAGTLVRTVQRLDAIPGPSGERPLTKRRVQSKSPSDSETTASESNGVPKVSTSKKRRVRTAAEEHRQFVTCPFCKKEFYAQVPRHLLTHKDVVKSPKQAVEIYNGLKKWRKTASGGPSGPSEEDLENIWGELWHDPIFREKLKQTCILGGVAWPATDAEETEQANAAHESQNSDSSSSESGSDAEADDETVRKRKKDLGLNRHVDKDHVVLQEFKAALRKVSGSSDSIKKSVDRLSSFLAFAEKDDPQKTLYWAVVNAEAGKKYMALNKQAGIANATKVTYAKMMAKLLELMKTRRKKMPSVPWGQPSFQEKYDTAVTLWGDIRRKSGRKSTQDRNDKLARGEQGIADLGACYNYLSSEREQSRVRADMARLKAFSKSKAILTFERRDVADVLAYNSVVRFLMMGLSIKNGGPRTGVLQNFRLSELAAGTTNGNKVIVRVARHKTGKHGNATLVMSREEHERLTDYVNVRKRIYCQDKEDKQRVFVTTGGLPFRTHNHDINVWMKKHGYPPVTTNSLRKAVETAASNHSVEVQRTVAKRLHHSVSTADQNYRVTTSDEVIREYEEVANVVNNQRALKYIISNVDELFVGMEEFPPIEEIEKTIGRCIQEYDLKLTQAVYKRARQAFDGRKTTD